MAAYRQVVAAFYIFLLMSSSPVDAARQKMVRDTYKNIKNVEHELATELYKEQAADNVDDLSGSNTSSGSLCGEKSLVLSSVVDDEKQVLHRFDSWDNVMLLKKDSRSGCVKTYVGQCAEGGVQVLTDCPGKSSKTTLRSFFFVHSRKTDIKIGESIEFKFDSATPKLYRGTVKFEVVKPKNAEQQCALLRESFETKLHSIRDELTPGNSLTNLDGVAAAYMLLKLRRATKQLKSAEKAGCEWLKDKSFEAEPLREIVKATSGSNPCFGKARTMLELAGGKTPKEQSEAFHNAIFMLASEDCAASKVTEASLKHKLASAVGDMMHTHDKLDMEVDANAEVMADALSDVNNQNVIRSHAPKSLFNSSDRGLEGPGDSMETAMLQTIEKMHAVSGSLDSARLGGVVVAGILAVLGFIVLVFALMLVCFAVIALTMSLLGLILCSLKSVFYWIINLFKKEDSKWRSDWKDCMDFWLSSVSMAGDGFDLAFCTASLMANNR